MHDILALSPGCPDDEEERTSDTSLQRLRNSITIFYRGGNMAFNHHESLFTETNHSNSMKGKVMHP